MNAGRTGSFLLLILAAAGMAGCSSRYVQTTIVNHTDRALKLIEVDYPSASFGTP